MPRWRRRCIQLVRLYPLCSCPFGYGLGKLKPRVCGGTITFVCTYFPDQTRIRNIRWTILTLKKSPVVAAWVFQLCGNGVAAASPAYGYNVRDGTSHGWTLAFVSLTFFYPAIALGKTAFTATLLRVSSGRTNALLWFIIAVACAFGITITVTSWLTPCGRQIDHVIPTICVSADTLIWIHVGNAIATICTDVVLAYVPWRIVNKIYIPQNEKWAVATSMSLVGLSAVVCIVR